MKHIGLIWKEFHQKPREVFLMVSLYGHLVRVRFKGCAQGVQETSSDTPCAWAYLMPSEVSSWSLYLPFEAIKIEFNV